MLTIASITGNSAGIAKEIPPLTSFAANGYVGSASLCLISLLALLLTK